MKQKILLFFILPLSAITFSACSTNSINFKDNYKYSSFEEVINPPIKDQYDIQYEYIYKTEKNKQELFIEFTKSENSDNLMRFLSDKPILLYTKNPFFINDDIRINYNQPPIITSATIKDLPLKLTLDKEYNYLPKNYRFSSKSIVIDISRNKDGINVYVLNKTNNTYILNDFEFIYDGFIYNKQINKNLIPDKVEKIFIPISEKYTKEKLVKFNLKAKHKIYKEEIIISEIIQNE